MTKQEIERMYKRLKEHLEREKKFRGKEKFLDISYVNIGYWTRKETEYVMKLLRDAIKINLKTEEINYILKIKIYYEPEFRIIEDWNPLSQKYEPRKFKTKDDATRYFNVVAKGGYHDHEIKYKIEEMK